MVKKRHMFLILALFLLPGFVSAQSLCQITDVSVTSTCGNTYAFNAVDDNTESFWNSGGPAPASLTVEYSCEKTASSYKIWCVASNGMEGTVRFYDADDQLIGTSEYSDCRDNDVVTVSLTSPVSAKKVVVEVKNMDGYGWTHINEFEFGGPNDYYPVGQIINIDEHGIVTGFAYDAGDPTRIIDVSISLDNGSGCVFEAMRRASLGYPDEHRFRYEVPIEYKDGGTYTLCAYGLDPEGIVNTELDGSPMTFSATTMGSTMPHTPDWAKDLILYKFRVDYFTRANAELTDGDGNFETAKEKIPYLKDLGVTGIVLYPIAEYDETRYPDCAYGVDDPTMPESSFGGEAGLIDFVQEAHDNGMKVFVDIVTFGLDISSDFVRSHSDWFIYNRDLKVAERECTQPHQQPRYDACMEDLCGPDRSRCCDCLVGRICDDSMECFEYYCDEEGRREERCTHDPAPIYDRSRTDIRSWWINDVALHWIEAYDIDGFRGDLEPWMSGFDTWKEVIETSHQRGKDIIVMSEGPTRHRHNSYHFGECGDFSVGNPRGRPDFLLTNPSKQEKIKNVYNIVGEIKNPFNQEIYHTAGFSTHNGSNQYDPNLDFFKAEGRIVYFAYGNLLAPFIPFMNSGEEFNAEVHVDPHNNIVDGNLAWIIIDWSDLDDPERQTFLEKVKKLIKIRKRYRSIIAPFEDSLYKTNIVKVGSTGTDLQAYALYGDLESSRATIVVVGKKDRASGYVTIDIPLNDMNMEGDGTYSVIDLMAGECIDVSESSLRSYTIPVDRNGFKAFKVEDGTCPATFCGNWICDEGESCSSCPDDCCNCVHPAEIEPCDGRIDSTELFAFIDLWKQNQATIEELMEAIALWKKDSASS